MVEVEMESEDEGICFNESMHARRTVKVKAGSKMCSLGDIRKGGARATMEQYCAECPYFIHDNFVGKWEGELEKHLKG